jgi:uncharacterized membrane protein YcaP (DUF421 family)
MHRILLGTAPSSFILEVLLRTCLVYAILVIVVRLLGKRMTGQLSNLELAVMLVLGAIVSAPMQIPERGIAPGALLLVLLLGLQRTLSALATRSARFERWLLGRTSILVKDGRIQLEALHRARISREQLLSTLRTQRFRHLGEVRRVYLESSGSFSVLRAPNPGPGLTLAADFDPSREPPAARAVPLVACGECGKVEKDDAHPQRCVVCGRSMWRSAVGEMSEEEHEGPRPNPDEAGQPTEAHQ